MQAGGFVASLLCFVESTFYTFNEYWWTYAYKALGANHFVVAIKPALANEQHLIDERVQALARFQRVGTLVAAVKALHTVTGLVLFQQPKISSF